MLQREGSRVKAGLEEDALERSASQSLSVSFAASLFAYSQFIVSASVHILHILVHLCV